MDFMSILAAAKNNSTQAGHEKGVVLKTKLSAPKKAEKKKVDVEALKKRLEEEQRRATDAAAKPKVPRPAKPSGDKVKKSADTAKMKSKIVDKPKYESKEHEQKHKEFMNKMQKVAAKTEAKSNNTSSTSKLSGSKKKPEVVKKVKPISNAPTFQDLIKMAEKVKADPDSVFREKIANEKKSDKHMSSNEGPDKHRLSNDKQRHSNGKLDKHKASDRGSEKHKLSNGKVNEHKLSNGKVNEHKLSNGKVNEHKLPNGKLDTHKHSKRDATSTNRPQADKRKEISDRYIKREALPSDDSQSKIGSKRPLGSGRSGNHPVPAKKPMLSEAAMAKLAMKEGRRPPPQTTGHQHMNNKSTQKKLNYTAPSQSSKPSSKSSENAPSKEKNVKESSKSAIKVTEKPGMSAWDRLMGSSGSNKDKAKKKPAHRFIDSEEEDDDLDGFIDDGDDEIDYSSAIRDIFGYDKSRYRDEDVDDRTMVAGFADIMKEEVRSTKAGLQEDLEDMALEEMEKKKKLMKKKKKN